MMSVIAEAPQCRCYDYRRFLSVNVNQIEYLNLAFFEYYYLFLYIYTIFVKLK